MKIRLRTLFKITTLVLLQAVMLYSQERADTTMGLNDDGCLKVWYVAGPFQQPIEGFGDPGDKEIIDEEKDTNHLTSDAGLSWIPKQVNDENFLDVKNIFGRVIDDSPNKVWFTKAAYAFAVINSEKEQNVSLSFGGNTISKVIVNGELFYSNNRNRNAVKDEIEKEARLRKGENFILVKVFNTHKNYSFSFFDQLRYEWGFYFRISKQEAEESVTQVIYKDELSRDVNVTPAFFMKEKDGELLQKIYVDLYSDEFNNTDVAFKLSYGENIFSQNLNVHYGHNLFELYIPVIKEPVNANLVLEYPDHVIKKEIEFEPPKKYELHLMLLSHTDIGYTNPQPVVKEKHISTLDAVLENLKNDENFKWTIETVWQLEEYRKAKSDEEFQELINFIKEGRIAVSPVYTNPFTGWISEEEAIESLSIAAEYKEKYGIEFNAAVYNDVPGESWFIPTLLKSAGVKFLANGINEIYNDYRFQRNLPKVFLWQGSDSSKVINYINDSYLEGLRLGMERNAGVIENRMWERINKLVRSGYNYDLILLNTAFTDNAGIALNQYKNALKWNEEYAYPKFVISDLSEFADEFSEKYADELPVVKGDFTSTWDILSQGEPGRSIKLRWIQNNVTSAAKLSGMLWLADPGYRLPSALYKSVFDNTLLFTGHGSGLEYGYGNSFDNYITDAYRENYITNAFLGTEELLERSIYSLTKPMEKLEFFGVIVFNPLSFQHDELISVEFSALENADYSVVDIKTGEKMPGYYDGSALKFIAKDLPGLGYRKYKFINNNGINEEETSTEDDFIENEFYKIKIDRTTGSVVRIFDKTLEQDIVIPSAFKPFEISKDLFDSTQNVKLDQLSDCKVEISKNNLYQTIVVKDKYELMPLMEVQLTEGIRSIDLKVNFDMRKLKETEVTENYNLVLPLLQNDSEVIFDILGGEFNADERPSWVGHNSYSIRDYARIKNNDYEVVIASPDARIFNLDKSADGSLQFLKVNLANNFPLSWNRNEKNDETLEYRFHITTSQNQDDDLNAVIFGKEKNTPSIIRKTWFDEENPCGQFVGISNPNIILNNIKLLDNTIIMELENISNQEQQVVLTSEDFIGKSFSLVNVWNENSGSINNIKDKEIKLDLKSGEIKYLKIIRSIK